MLPGSGTAKTQHEFVGREDPPVLDTSIPGRTFLLKAGRLGSISVGSPIFYRDLPVGEVLGWDIAKMAESVTIHAFVRAPFDGYVNDQARFWNASGVSVKLGGTGVEVQLESLKALLLGGIAFDGADTGDLPASAANHEFPMFPDHDAANSADYSRKISVVAYFPGSVRGLGPGSEVVMRGLKVGQVTGVHLAYDPVREDLVAPVRFDFQPERILGAGVKAVFPTTEAAAQEMVRRGLRAKLESANLITGQQLVSLVFVKDAPAAEVTFEGDVVVLPTTGSGSISDLQTSASDLLQKVDEIPFGQIGRNLDGILQSLNDLAGGPQTKQVVKELASAVSAADKLVQRVDGGMSPVLRQLPEIAAGLQKTVANADKLLLSFNAGYGDNTKFNRDLERLLVQLNDAVRSIRSLADLLTRHPDALLKGRSDLRTE
jgi:paraquat-inducible protein B